MSDCDKIEADRERACPFDAAAPGSVVSAVAGRGSVESSETTRHGDAGRERTGQRLSNSSPRNK